MPERWFALNISEILKALRTDAEKGLSKAEAAKRLAEFGPNRLIEQGPPSALRLFFAQFNNFMVWILIAAIMISGYLAEWGDSAAIIAIVILNAALGFVQESKALRSLAALKKLSAPTSRVLREGEIVVMPADEVVPGDIVELEAGDYVPADVRLLSVSRLAVQEAALTGESVPVNKTARALDQQELALADRINMAFMGTSVVAGKACAVVVAGGMNTELGKIAGLLRETGEGTSPLQQHLDKFGHRLVYFTLIIVGIIFLMELRRGGGLLDTFMVAVSLAVAAIPEGLPAVVTIALALGVNRMVKRNALIRRLHSVETLGCTSVICSDKTGTLTQNEMTVRKVYCDGSEIEVSGAGYEPAGSFSRNSECLDMVLKIGVLCNSAHLRKTDDSWKIIGDPTEGALLTLAGKASIFREDILKSYRIIAEIPFDAERKRMTSIYDVPEGILAAFGENAAESIAPAGVIAAVKGAPDVILGKCRWYLDRGEVKPLIPSVTEQIRLEIDTLAGQAMRVLGMAYRLFPQKPDDLEPGSIETELVFTGLVAMIDPPRPEVKFAIEKCREAGIRTVMITGDHKNTAIAIARELGFFEKDSEAVTGLELDAMSDEELQGRIQRINVYARVSAENKLRIVRAWKKSGAVVAMTGDGVNDAPAVKEADIGVAMGITGTDVTKDASDMVITDDNFASIVAAVEEGRGIYGNIKKFIYFLLSCNMGEILTMFLATLFALPVPLYPIQILWINIVTDGLPAIALGVEPISPSVMKERVRRRDEEIFNWTVVKRLFWQGVAMAFVTIAAFLYVLYIRREDIGQARTMAFCVLVFTQLFHALACRSQKEPLFKIGFFSNRFLLATVAASIILQMMLHHFSFTNMVLKTQPLGAFDLLLSLGIAIIPMLIAEGMKVTKKGMVA